MTNSKSVDAVDVLELNFFEDGLMVMTGHYCRDTCHKTVVRVYNKEFTVLQKMFSESNFLKLVQYEGDPRLVACLPKECSVYEWDDGHFVNPYTMALDFQVTEIATKFNHVFMRSQENGIYMYSRREKTYEGMVNLTDVFGQVQIHAISTDFDSVLLIVTSLNETSLQFRSYEIKNDTNLILGSEILPNIRDPFDEIEGCANRLKQQFDKSFAMITKINSVLPKIKQTTQKVHFAKVTVNNTVSIKSTVSVGNITLRSDSPFDAKKALEKLQKIQNKTREARERSHQLVLIDDPTPRDGGIFVEGDVSSLLIAKTIRVKNLHTTSPLFNNLITRTGRNVLKGHLTVGNLIAPQLHVPEGIVNNIPLNDMYARGLTVGGIKGKKFLKDLKVNRMTIGETLNGLAVKQLANIAKEFDNPRKLKLKRVHAKSLTVNSINGVHVDTFFRDYYRANDPKSKIKGNLIFTSPISIRNLITPVLNRVPVTDYFTQKLDQNITRKVIFKNVFVPTLNAKRINGIEFGKTVAIQGQKNFIETPVQIHQMKVEKRLILSEQENREMTQHIVGTRVEDLSQSYSGRVIIRGNLIVHNVTLENPINLFLDLDQKFPLDTLSNYWTKNTSQRINKKVHLKGRISTSQLLTESINNHPVSAFVTTDQETLTTDSSIHFQDVVVERNIRTSGVSKILEISRNVVRKGEKTVLEGVKHFENITTNHLISSLINGQQISNHFLNLNSILVCDHKISFEELHLATDIDYPLKNLQVETIDRVNMQSLFADTVYINRPTELVSLHIDKFTANGDLTVGMVNGVDTAGALERINNLRFVVNVTGTANIQRLFADTVNGVHVSDYFGMLVRRDRRGQQELGGQKKFLKGFTVLGDLRVQNLSGVDVKNWMENALRWDDNHVIAEEWVFKDVEVDSLYANMINGVPTELFINSRDRLTFNQDLDVNELIVENGNLVAKGAQDWSQVVHNLLHPLPRKWQHIEVTGDIVMPQIKSKLGELITHGMSNRQSQAITGHMVFRGLTKIKKLVTHNFTINGIDLDYVLRDTLLDNSPTVQTVSGPVAFEKGFEVNTLRAANLDVVHINDIDMVQLNESLWRPSIESTLPPLHLPAITVDNLKVTGRINGISTEDLNTIDNVNVLNMRIAPNFTIHGNLRIDFINGMPFNYLILSAGRLKAKNPQRFTGGLTFENLVIRGASKVHSINGIPINSLILSKSNQLQTMSGVKGFTSITFNGPSNINSMNNVPVTEMYKRVVDKQRNQLMNRFNAKEIVAQRGLDIRKSLNDIPIEFFGAEELQLPNIEDMQHQLTKILSKDLNSRQAEKRFNYFDYAYDFQVSSKGNDSTHIVLNRYTKSDCQRTVEAAPKCHCKRQVEIQLSKFNEIQVHPRTDIQFDGQIGSVDVQISVNHSCDPDRAVSSLQVSRDGNSVKMRLEGVTKFIGTTFQNANLNVFITATEFQENLTISTWAVDSRIRLNRLRNLVFAHSVQSNVHVMQHKSDHLLIVSSTTTNQLNPKLIYVYRYDPLNHGFKLQHILRTYYDLFSSINTDTDSYLAASLSGDKLVDIYRVYLTAEGTHQLSSRTQIPFEYAVRDLLAFRGQDQVFVAALLDNGHLYIFRYNFVEVRMECDLPECCY